MSRLRAAVLILSLAYPAIGAADEPAMDGPTAYKTFCVSCHGETGLGDGLAAAALDPRPASFGDAAFWASRDDKQLFQAIKEGGLAVGKSPLMAPWGGVLDDTQIHALLTYLKTFKP